MRLFGLTTCDTCRKAKKALVSDGYAPDFVDVRTDGIDRATLERFHAEFGADLLNRRSTTWRGLSESERAGAPPDLIATHPALMKRPVIEADDGTLYLGWGRDVQAALLG
ncbi:glutaredoxin domain-containing protein [Psychromarinibacter sp. C21-152]|uniref:Glutaredoxin domain-containing protein n=1 Tax=Psychromarinibacter sediminicola TaxID=3033385 RepID=A0AAE3NQD7_9RHOB|nr:ArsC/Spx/MgsR family protein [Psychromarinibacter sediminicola]MDF0600121.1 glutaredoxin domain-containing protein [Psychromarinibacter sediminicola]